MSALLHTALRRRAFLQLLTAVPALALFRTLPPARVPEEGDDDIVQVGGWLLKRSDVA